MELNSGNRTTKNSENHKRVNLLPPSFVNAIRGGKIARMGQVKKNGGNDTADKGLGTNERALGEKSAEVSPKTMAFKYNLNNGTRSS